jgi:hypothetical protein
MDAESQLLADLKAEVERLTRELREERESFLSRQLHDTAEIARLKKLITELCDALDAYTPDAEGGYRKAKELIQRAREATR